MKRTLFKSSLVLLLMSAVFAPVFAIAVPSIALYFDRALTRQYADCPDAPLGVLDTLFVAISGFDTPVEGIEYQILFPEQIAWLGDFEPENGLMLGNSAAGQSIAFFTPQDASSPVIIQEILVLWMCQGCVATSVPIEITTHPMTGSLRAVTSDLVFEDVVGYTSLICPTCLGCTAEGITATSRAAPLDYLSDQCVLDCPSGDGGVIIPGDPPGQHHSPDLNGDELVDIVDFSLFAVNYLTLFDPDTDFYCSGNVDLIDFVFFARHWLHSRSVPVEPRTWGNIKALYLD